MIRIFLIFYLGCTLFPVAASALMPPEDIAARNLDAELILIGEVVEIGKILLPLHDKDTAKPKGIFVIKTQHMIKGFGQVKPGDLVRIAYRLPPEVAIGLQTVIAGNPPVEVSEGDVVLVYINATKHKGFHTPVMAGSSVLRIFPEQQADEKAVKD